MGSIKKKFKELLHEYDLIEDDEMVEFAMEVFKLGCKHGEMKAEGFGLRDDDDMFDDDDDDGFEDIFRVRWNRGGFGERSGSGGRSGGGRSGGGGYGQRRGVRGSGRSRR